MTVLGVPGLRARFDIAVIIAATLALAACASAFDRSFDAGQYDEAIRVFAADSALHDEPGALYRAALAYATPDHPAYDPARALELLRDLLDRFPGSGEHPQAVALFGLLESSDRLARDGARIESELQDLRGQVAALERRLAEQEAMHAEIAASNVVLRDSLERTQRVLRVREAQMRALQDELRALKRIDLGPVPPDTTIS